ncbi:hypothetical protein ISS05_04215 [Candidatus Woesearchaeota archaeon]|nr:hypothetical protein [Candidatus Woesearchaeota archaeon]
MAEITSHLKSGMSAERFRDTLNLILHKCFLYAAKEVLLVPATGHYEFENLDEQEVRAAFLVAFKLEWSSYESTTFRKMLADSNETFLKMTALIEKELSDVVNAKGKRLRIEETTHFLLRKLITLLSTE